ncbi:MAG: hypothetical protein MJZ76_10470, partial [Bacteroidales bacterium]|nr:hypothetical protein [Bacteroidales bacterium]
ITTFYILITLLLFSSCKREPLSWDIDMGLPICKAELSIADILPDSIVSLSPDQNLSIVLDKEIFSISTNSIAEFPDSLFEFALDVPTNTSLAPGALFFHKNEVQKLPINPAQLTFAKIFSGNLTVQVINPFDKPIEITYKIPAATLSGTSFSQTIVVPAGMHSGTTFTKHLDMSGYCIDLKGNEGNNYNRFTTILNAKIQNQGTDSAISIGNKLYINIRFNDVKLDYVKGYFGQLTEHYGPQNLDIDIFKTITNGTLDLKQCNAKILIENGLGADAQLTLKQLKAKNTQLATEVSLQSLVIGKSHNVTRATEIGQTVIPSQTTIDLSNSNLKDLLSIFPDQLEYAAQLSLNPMGNISSGNDFVYRNHPFVAKLHLDMPLAFAANDLTLQKDIEYHLGQSLQNVQSGTLHLISDNYYPFSTKVSLQIVNDMGDVIIDLTPEPFILHPGTNGTDGTTIPYHSTISIKLNEKEATCLKDNTHIRITAVFNTPDNGQVQINAEHKLNIKLTSEFNYKISEENLF